MTILVTASNEKYSRARDFNILCGKRLGGFDKVIGYRIETVMDNEFLNRNRAILKNSKGSGLWLWKPYCIYKALSEICKEGDVLFYLDAAAFVYKRVAPFFESMKQDIYAVELPYLECEFTKKEVFNELDIVEDSITNTRQFQASYMAFRKNEKTVTFVKEWLDLCQNHDLISPVFDKEIQIDGFYEHRMDQSLFSILCKKYGVTPSPEITQFRKWGYPYIAGVSYLPLKGQNSSLQSIFLHRRPDVPSLGGIMRALIIYFNYFFKSRKLIPNKTVSVR